MSENNDLHRSAPLPCEGEVCVTVNGVTIHGCKVTELRELPSVSFDAPVLIQASGSFEIQMCQSAADRLRHWIDVTTVPRYWLRRAHYVRRQIHRGRWRR